MLLSSRRNSESDRDTIPHVSANRFRSLSPWRGGAVAGDAHYTSTFDRLYDEARLRERRRAKAKAEHTLQVQLGELEPCTFQPAIARRSHDLFPDPDPLVFQRLATPRRRSESPLQPTSADLQLEEQLLACTFTPVVNHNPALDSKLREWARGVSVHDRLFGVALIKREEALRREEVLRREELTRSQRKILSSARIDRQYERAVAFLYDEDDGCDVDDAKGERSGATARSHAPNNTTNTVALGVVPSAGERRVGAQSRYLEPASCRRDRIELLRRRFKEEHSFAPRINERRPRTATSSRPGKALDGC